MFWSWFANILQIEVLIHLVPKVLEPNSCIAFYASAQPKFITWIAFTQTLSLSYYAWTQRSSGSIERVVLSALKLCGLKTTIVKLLEETVKDDGEFLNSKDHDGGNTILHIAVMLKQIEVCLYFFYI